MQPEIILASASSRREDLIRQAGLPVVVRPVDVDETFGDLPPVEETIRLAGKKIEAALSLFFPKRQNYPERDGQIWLVTADTIVALEGRKLGKPAMRAEAEEFLLAMSGKNHQVITGLVMYSYTKGVTTASAVTDVRFSKLTNREIEWYLDTEEWRGVAAGYRIQGGAARFIQSIQGSYSNVMGLPIHTFYGMLRIHGYPLY